MLTALIVLPAAALALLAGEAVRALCHRMLSSPAFVTLRATGEAELPADAPAA